MHRGGWCLSSIYKIVWKILGQLETSYPSSIYSIQSKSSIPILQLVHYVCDARPIALIEKRVVNRSSRDAADNRGDYRDDEIVVVRGEHLSPINDCRE